MGFTDFVSEAGLTRMFSSFLFFLFQFSKVMVADLAPQLPTTTWPPGAMLSGKNKASPFLLLPFYLR